MQIDELRIALFSGNYNYVRDGANKALNQLVGYLLNKGAKVRIYSPTISKPAFRATGELISIPSFAIPGREEYRFPLAITPHIKRNLSEFNPNIVHTSSPDLVGHRAVTWARSRALPILSSVHTRFDSYAHYYGMGFIEPLMITLLRRYYQRCDALVVPSESMATILREQKMHDDISIWSRGIDREIFDPSKRSDAWRASLGIKEGDIVIGFLGRLVMEKGLDIFAKTIEKLRSGPHKFKILVIGKGPAKNWFAQKIPEAIFVGFQSGSDLGRAVASMDILFNPSITETFGNVTLEAMASGVPIVAARAAGSVSLVVDNHNGMLITPGKAQKFAHALENYIENPALRDTHGRAGEALSRTYDWDNINQVLADKYIKIISARNR